MTRGEAKKAAEVMKAYAEGKKIEYYDNETGKWLIDINPSFNFNSFSYRIKKELTYRPFKNQEECWNEMHKHSDFGWVKNENCIYLKIVCIASDIYFSNTQVGFHFKEAYTKFSFIDGTPFGMKEE